MTSLIGNPEFPGDQINIILNECTTAFDGANGDLSVNNNFISKNINLLNPSALNFSTTITATATENYPITLPPTQGLANQTLVNNGSGVLSWATPTSSSSLVAGTGISLVAGPSSTTITNSLPFSSTNATDLASVLVKTQNISQALTVPSSTTFAGSLTSSGYVVSGGTNIQYLLADGSTLTHSANSGNSNFFLYNCINTTLAPPLTSGQIKFNNATQTAATILYISVLTRDGVDISVYFSQLSVLNAIYIQQQTGSTNYIQYSITAAPSIIGASYVQIPVAVMSSAGTGSTTFGNTTNIMMSIFTNSQESSTRITNLETKTQNQTAIPSTTTFAGTTVLDAGTVNNTLTLASLGIGMAISGTVNGNLIPSSGTKILGQVGAAWNIAEINTVNNTTHVLRNGATNSTSLTTAAASASIPFALPSLIGSANQILTTNGSGQSSWATATGGGNVSALSITGATNKAVMSLNDTITSIGLITTNAQKQSFAQSFGGTVNFTSVERDSLTWVSGDIIYNKTYFRLEKYNGSIWVSTDGTVGQLDYFDTSISPLNYQVANGSSVSRIGVYSELWTLNTSVNPLLTPITCTITIANPAVITKLAHGLTNGQRVRFTTTGALPTGLVAGTDYIVNILTGGTFRLSTNVVNALAGTYLTTSGTQSGTHSYTNTLYGQGNGTTTQTLIDARGLFLRGTDPSLLINTTTFNGNGSLQGDAIRNITGQFNCGFENPANPTGSFTTVNTTGDGVSGNGGFFANVIFNASGSVPTGTENRPKHYASTIYIKYL